MPSLWNGNMLWFLTGLFQTWLLHFGDIYMAAWYPPCCSRSRRQNKYLRQWEGGRKREAKEFLCCRWGQSRVRDEPKAWRQEAGASGSASSLTGCLLSLQFWATISFL